LRSKSFQARFGTLSKAEYHKHFQKVMREVFEAEGTFGDSSLPALRSEYEEASKLFDSEYNICRDVVALGKSQDGTTFVVHVLQLRQGLIAGQFSYTVELSSGLTCVEDFSEAIQIVLEHRHYPSGEVSTCGRFSFFPDEVLCQYSLLRTKELKEAIRFARNQAEPDRKGSKIDIRTLASRGTRKDADSRALECAMANAEQVANEKSMTNIPGVLKSSVDGTAARELVSLLSLEKTPERIECYDISHTQGEGTVGSRVVFINGRPAPNLYRKFNVNSVDGVDDYASLQEVLQRRFRRAWKKIAKGELVDKSDPWAMPDLVIIDGGKGQLTAALKGMAGANVYPSLVSTIEATPALDGSEVDSFVIHEEVYPSHATVSDRQTTVNVVALAKNKEDVYTSSRSHAVNDSPDSPALLLLRALRDESHRFALNTHRRRRSRLNGL
jgi:excinuclease UvrABC nuclease subunit